ncbi:hypothetical protein OAG71_02335, partial [bacterium]|nr:hypothetical protein [bacterium]
MRSFRLQPFQSNLCRLLSIGILLLFCAGCEKKSVQRLTIDNEATSTTSARTYPCTVLLVGNDWLKEPLQRQWSARQDSDFEIQTESVEAFAAADFEIRQGVDVVIYPANLMIELIHRGRIVKLNKSVYQSESFNKDDVLTHFRKSGIRYDSETWAVPCGGSMFSLLYQPEALSTTQSQLPETWSQLIRWGERLNEKNDDSNNADSSQGIAVPLAEGWAAKSFITIAASYARKKGRLSVLFERRTMKPLITSEAFVRGLEELKSLAKLNPQSLQWTPQDIFENLVQGKLSAGVTWPRNSLPADIDETAAQNLLVHSLPGSSTYFDESSDSWGTRQANESSVVNLHGINNLLASQTKISRRPQSAVAFLKWLPESTISQTLFASNPNLGPFRVTHLGDAQTWIGDQFSSK